MIDSFQAACFISVDIFGIKFKVWDYEKKYLDDKSFYLNVKKLIALAFVSVSDVNKGFDVVADGFGDGAEDLFGYFEKTWIGEPKRKGKLLVYQSFFDILF